VDYHFRTREQVGTLRFDQRYAVLDVRGDLQALDLVELRSLLNSGDVIYEGNPFVGMTRFAHPLLVNIAKLSAFLSRLSKPEILYLQAPERNVDLEEFVSDVMRRKLLRRTRRQKGELSAQDLEDIEKRAASAFAELQTAWHFDHVIPNHDGEDSDNWAFYYPIGDARNSLLAFVALLEGRVVQGVEKWDAQLLPSPN
jgi:guanylate kinase